ncbi:MAG TPA: hypothetical protein VFN92_08180 [Solirubrobacterales bacterium]|nr:hypothetical protein [Solirubrobacterales bacterium]
MSPQYKLRVPEPGTFLYGDGPEAVVATSIEEARDLLETFEVHSEIGICRIVYKADVDNGEAHEGAEPGDTTVWYQRDDGRDLEEGEVRVWIAGPPSWSWSLGPDGVEPLSLSDIPVGSQFALERGGEDLETTGPAIDDGETITLPVRLRLGGDHDALIFEKGATGHSIFVLPYLTNPLKTVYRYRLTVEGEEAEGTEEEMNQLRRDAVAALTALWRRGLYAAEGLHPDYGPAPGFYMEESRS